MGSETEWNYTRMECISQQETLKFTAKSVESSVKYSKGGRRAVYVPCLGEQNRLLSDQDNTQPRKKNNVSWNIKKINTVAYLQALSTKCIFPRSVLLA